MDEFPANSQKAKATDAPREKINPVTSAKTGKGKRGLGRQFKNTFFSGSGRGALEYMVEDVVVPAIRDTLYDALQSGLGHLVYGDRASGRTRSRSPLNTTPVGRVNYGDYATPSRSTQSQPRMLSRRARARHNFDELIIDSRQEAEEVLDQMFEILSRSGEVGVADLYALTNIRPDHTDMKYGWTNLRGAKAVRLRQGGFLLDLPEPEPLA